MFEIAIVVLLVIIAYNTKNGFERISKRIEKIESDIDSRQSLRFIKPLDINDIATVEAILDVQQKSYRVESDLIGFEIPRLNDDIESIQDSGEQFYGYYAGSDLVGIISFMKEESFIDIHRLAISPLYFKQGIATELYNHISTVFNGIKQVVATGKKNEPAIHFYIKNGFEVKEEIEIEDGLYIVKLEK